MYVMEHYHEVDKHALILTWGLFMIIFLEIFYYMYNISVILTCNIFVLRHHAELVRLFHHMRRICNKEPSLCLWSPVTIKQTVFDWIWENILANGTYCLYLYPFLVICQCMQYICSIHLAEIFLTFKIRFKTKFIFQQLWQCRESCICHHFQLFPWLLRHLPCLL